MTADDDKRIKPGERFPTTGPQHDPFDRYHFVTTSDGRALIYDGIYEKQWIEAHEAVSLEEWR